ncbi:MAG: hypothetical protein KC561_13330 [Myxococcales bacterium]|nr:hypothetical protein [Myxococcales bacterium]
MSDEFEDDRKEKVLHARVSENLDHELKARAKALGMSVSNLVRNVLQHSMGLVGDVVVDGANIGRAFRGDQQADVSPVVAAPSPASNLVLGWQGLTLNLNAICGRCNAILPKGSRAAVSVTTSGMGQEIICPDCVPSLDNEERQ